MTLPQVDYYSQWVQNEYRQWAIALDRSSVVNFKDEPAVRRMLSIPMEFPVPVLETLPPETLKLLLKIDDLGYSRTTPSPARGDLARMVYYAQQVLERNPLSIVEIGGGVGEFYAVMRALGYTGNYYIMDLLPVKSFQFRYLQRISTITGLHFPQRLYLDYCVSLYALGEFDDDTKNWYVRSIVRNCLHGFIIWNPHSGASEEIAFPCTVKDEFPLLAEGCKQLEW